MIALTCDVVNLLQPSYWKSFLYQSRNTQAVLTQIRSANITRLHLFWLLSKDETSSFFFLTMGSTKGAAVTDY